MSSASNSSDNSGPDEQQKEAQPEIQHQAPVAGSFQPALPAASAGYLMPHSHPEGHAMAQMAYPYIDPYSGGIFAAYGGQPMIHPHLVGVHHPGMPLPTDAVEEPVYVNAKQYHGILRRRQSRAKAESENKLIKSRKPYLHESRHLHALKRARGCGGRFLNKKSDENQQDHTSKSEENQQNPDSESEGNKQNHTSNSEENQQNLTSESDGNQQNGAASHDKAQPCEAQPSAGPASEILFYGNQHNTLLSDDTTHPVEAADPDKSSLDSKSGTTS